jgi:hypothetical protein
MVIKMDKIRQMAKDLGVKTGRKSKAAVIREIQLAEGNFDCYGSASGECDQTECIWREMCFAHEEE